MYRNRTFVDYYTAKSEASSQYDIKPVSENCFEHFYVMFKPGNFYGNQVHVLEIKTSYGSGSNQYMYPKDMPYVRFLTSIWHTNVNTHGTICLDILKDSAAWSPINDFQKIINSILILLQDPNNSSPFNGAASSLYILCERTFIESVNKSDSYQAQEEYKMKCFKPFIEKAEQYASSNKIENYIQWFPQIKDATHDLSAEVVEAKEVLAKLKKKPEAEKVQLKKKPWEKYQK